MTSLNRDEIWLAQTPQVFMTEMYRAAAYHALKDGLSDVTDDAALFEALGGKVTPVECGSDNIKITHPIDFIVAEAILCHREKEANS